NQISALYLDHGGRLWIGTNNGLDYFNDHYKSFTHYRNQPADPNSLSNNSIFSIYEDQSGVLWVGTYGGGLNKYDRQQDEFSYLGNDPSNKDSLSGNMVFPIYVDPQGIVWIGTYGNGLNRYNPVVKQFTYYRNDPENPDSLSSDEVFSIYMDSQGSLWVGTARALDRLDIRTGKFTHYRPDANTELSLSGLPVYSIYEDKKGNLWFGTSRGLDQFEPRTETFIHYAPASAQTSGGQVVAMAEDNNGWLWVGTFGSGLHRFNPDGEGFIHYMNEPNDPNSLSNDSVWAIHEDRHNNLWIGTGGGGLDRYDPKTDSFVHYTERDGLPSNVIYGILEDDAGDIWLSTNNGLSRFDPKAGVFRNFTAANGLQSNEFNMSAYALSPRGEMYFGGINGVTSFDPLNITDDPYVPPIQLTSLTQEGKPMETGTQVQALQNIILNWPNNSFEFEFAALAYGQPSKNQYAYKLVGFDQNWNSIGTQRNGRYTNLPGGTYTLLLKGSNSDGIWNQTAKAVTVTVIPPFWQTTWFRILAGLTLAAAIAGGYRLRLSSVQNRNRALETLVHERTSALEKRTIEMEALYQADEKILRTVSLNQVFQTLVDVAVDILQADRSAVFAWDEEQACAVPRVSHGFSAKTLAVLKFAKGEGMVGQVLATGEPVIVPVLQSEELRPDVRAAILEEGIHSFVHLPIKIDSRIVGVFNVGFTRPGAINDDIVRVFTALVQRASMSIANMQLFEQTKDLAVMEERNRLARDLHDSAKQKAFAALAQLGTANGILSRNQTGIKPHLNEAENLVYEVIQELTFLIQEIYPMALQEKGLSTTLREYIFEWENRNDITVNLNIRSGRRLKLDTEQAIYRIIQEALANVARHSQASRVEISIIYHADSLDVTITDNGRGFDVNQKVRGMGLRSIRERVGSIRGSVQVQSAPGHGTSILIQVPIKKNEMEKKLL
ncbi:MAG TPA: two-component regulator propeller domain-containing protein, partial [Anaerolineales bacterium]|nr:two-component regulator propeller domain-containing protein [Anaerolineales bacterium]